MTGPRRMWQALEPVHAVVYFAPESRAATDALGAKGGWMSYFALRAAPLGPVSADLVRATFYGFAPDRVQRAVPAAWQAASPEGYLAARLQSLDAALRRLLGPLVDTIELAEAAGLARRAALAAPTAGRPLGAANAALAWPDEAHLVLWHAQTVLRESRGDGHVAALVAADLSPAEALVAFAAEGRVDGESLRNYRGWTAAEWIAAQESLRARGLLNAAGDLTAAGRDVRGFVESSTDRAAMPSWSELGEAGCERLVELSHPITAALVAGGALPAGNPIGLRPLPPG
ncbi:MAG: SCO6745 family protein [Sporichthyaceae bacterium]